MPEDPPEQQLYDGRVVARDPAVREREHLPPDGHGPAGGRATSSLLHGGNVPSGGADGSKM